MEEPIPTPFKRPRLELYNGTIDLLDYIESYKTFIMIEGIMDALFCLAFLVTL